MFHYRTYPTRSRFVLTLSGDYSHDPDAAHAGLHEAVREAKTYTDYFDMIVDMSEFFVAPRDRTDSGGAMITWCMDQGLRYGAFVTESVLMRMQLKRLSGQSDKMGYFDTRLEAERWLNQQA